MMLQRMPHGQVSDFRPKQNGSMLLRGGTLTHGYTYSGSNTIGDVAWYISNSGNRTQAVGTKAPNELGLYDMSGNVWEWCTDWYDAGYYSVSPSLNPKGPSSGTSRVLRGGSWINVEDDCRVAARRKDRTYAQLR